MSEKIADVTAPIFPAQCECGYLYLEKYVFPKKSKDGAIGFCWCGFCREKYLAFPMQEPT